MLLVHTMAKIAMGLSFTYGASLVASGLLSPGPVLTGTLIALLGPSISYAVYALCGYVIVTHPDLAIRSFRRY